MNLVRKKITRTIFYSVGCPSEKPRTAVVIGGGVLGLSTSLQLAERGVQVTLLEANSGPAQVASYLNGAVIVPSMAASWASATVIAKNPGELKTLKVSFSALSDINFWKWSAWFWYNSLWPGRAEYNHESQRLLALFSRKCMMEEFSKYGSRLDMGTKSEGTLKVYYDKQDLDEFLNSTQAMFWKERGLAFKKLSPEECFELEPCLASLDDWKHSDVSGNEDLVGGVLCSMDTCGDIATYSTNLEKLCKEKGVKFKYSSKVESFDLQADQVKSVKLESGEQISGDVYILAVGVKSQELGSKLGLNLPVYPLKGHLATVPYSDELPKLKRNIYSLKHGLICPIGSGSVRMSGIVEAVGYNFTVEPEKGKSLVEKAQGMLKPGFLREDQSSFHSCLRPVCCDDVAILGRSSIQNVYINTGQGSKGWTFSWGSSTFLAQLICGEETDLDPQRYSPNRFKLM